MKKITLLLMTIFTLVGVSAQEVGKVRLGINAGVAIPKNGFGGGGDLDFRYNIIDNWNLGLKLGFGGLVKDIEMYEDNNSIKATAMGVTNVLLHSDYYLNSGKNIFAPFLGGGIGYFHMGNTSIKENDVLPEDLSISPESKFGGFVRFGFEIWRVRLGIEYYMIPKSSLRSLNNHIIGETKNNFWNISLGFYIGGGSWKK